MFRVSLSDQDKDYIAVILIAIVSFAVYFNSLGNPFVFDDLHMIEKNTYIKYINKAHLVFLHYPTNMPMVRGMYRPLLMLSFAFNYYFSKLNPLGYHIINIMFHFLNGILVFLLLRFFLKRQYFLPSLLAVLMFIVHPVNVEAVTYISNRSTLMSGFFMLLSFLLYVKKDYYKSPKNLYCYFGSLMGYICALLSKEVAIMLPVILFFYDIMFMEGYKIKKFLYKLRFYLVIFIITISYLFLRKFLFGAFANTALSRSIYSNILTQIHVSAFYLTLIFSPVNLCLARRFEVVNSFLEPGVFMSFVVILLMLALAIIRYRKNKFVTFSILWFYINLIPKFIGTLSVLAAEQHLYLSIIGVIFLAAIVLDNLFNIKQKFTKEVKIGILIISLVILLSLSIRTIKQNKIWNSVYSIWSNTIRVSPRAYGAYNNLAIECLDKDRLDEGIGHVKFALNANPPVNQEAILRTTLATIYLEKKYFDQAIRELNKAIKLNPNFPEPYVNLGNAYCFKKQFNLALSQYKRAIEINPDSFEAHFNLGLFYYQKKEYDLAIQDLKQAIYLKPELYSIDLYLAECYAKKGFSKEAIKAYKTALAKLPSQESHFIYYDRGIIYGKIGNPQAIEEFNKALKLNPQYAPAHYNLAVSFAYLSPPKIELARRHLDLAIKYGYKPDPKFLSYLKDLEK